MRVTSFVSILAILATPAFAAAQDEVWGPPPEPEARAPEQSTGDRMEEDEQSQQGAPRTQGAPSTGTPAPNAPTASQPPPPAAQEPAPTAPAGPPPSEMATMHSTRSTSSTGEFADDPLVTDQEPAPSGKLLHGFRLGYAYLFEGQPHQGLAETDRERYGLDSGHQFILGYEAFYRVIGHSWLNVLLVANVMVAGLDQSQFLPSANLLLGFEFDESFQIGLGMNLAPDEEKPTHMIVAAGWTPRVGSFYVPLHAFLVPDVDGAHRVGATVGVTL